MTIVPVRGRTHVDNTHAEFVWVLTKRLDKGWSSPCARMAVLCLGIAKGQHERHS